MNYIVVSVNHESIKVIKKEEVVNMENSTVRLLKSGTLYECNKYYTSLIQDGYTGPIWNNKKTKS